MESGSCDRCYGTGFARRVDSFELFELCSCARGSVRRATLSSEDSERARESVALESETVRELRSQVETLQRAKSGFKKHNEELRSKIKSLEGQLESGVRSLIETEDRMAELARFRSIIEEAHDGQNSSAEPISHEAALREIVAQRDAANSIEELKQEVAAKAMDAVERIRESANSRDRHTAFNLLSWLVEFNAWSQKTFGPHQRAEGVLDHLRKELKEIEQDPGDLFEWIDVVILGFDGALRQGFDVRLVAKALWSKHEKNARRKWPDWREVDVNKAIEHDRSEETEYEYAKGGIVEQETLIEDGCFVSLEVLEDAKDKCSGCGSEIDPDTCWCGQDQEDHRFESHSFVPMGCDCGRDKGEPVKE